VPALLSLVFVPPSIAAAILHRTSPPQPVVPPHANHSFPPSGSGRHARFHAPARSGRRTAAAHLPRSCFPAHAPPPACACHHRWRLLRSRAVCRGTSSGCHLPRVAAPPSAEAPPPTAPEGRRSSGMCQSLSTTGRQLSIIGRTPAVLCHPLSFTGQPPALLCR
jgi:hypothetical protein